MFLEGIPPTIFTSAARAKAGSKTQSRMFSAAPSSVRSRGNRVSSSGNIIGNSGSSFSTSGSELDARASVFDLQSSLTLDPSVISNFTDDGQNPPVVGQSPSFTSRNNYINFCALNLPLTPLTNGLPITTGSCNPVPMGLIPSTANMPSAKFTSPENFGTIVANTAFTMSLELRGMHSGVITSAAKTFLAAPQMLDANGLIMGHTKVVIDSLDSLDQTAATDPTAFVVFKSITDAAVNGILSTAISLGVPPGFYRACSMNSAANHQPVVVPIELRGSLNDCIYFTAIAGSTTSTIVSGGITSTVVRGPASSIVRGGVTSTDDRGVTSVVGFPTAKPTQSTQPVPSIHRNTLRTGAIIGIVIGVCAILSLAAFLVWFKRRRRRSEHRMPVGGPTSTPFSLLATAPSIDASTASPGHGGVDNSGAHTTHGSNMDRRQYLKNELRPTQDKVVNIRALETQAASGPSPSPLPAAAAGAPTPSPGPGNVDNSDTHTTGSISTNRRQYLQSELRATQEKMVNIEALETQTVTPPAPGGILRLLSLNVSDSRAPDPDPDTARLRERNEMLMARIRELEEQAESPWALGLSDEPPPGYVE
ncbi:hypothetical protein DFH09DRAFT_1178149 [Mycena vulgaris]|nr:hypothetical protein DFH09DRAFT_1178149 [Mycena vulgaris]